MTATRLHPHDQQPVTVIPFLFDTILDHFTSCYDDGSDKDNKNDFIFIFVFFFILQFRLLFFMDCVRVRTYVLLYIYIYYTIQYVHVIVYM